VSQPGLRRDATGGVAHGSRGALFRCGILVRLSDGHLRGEQDVFLAEHALEWLCGAPLQHKWALGLLAEEPPWRAH